MLTIEEVKALYFDADALREPTRKLRRIDGGDLRWYYAIENDNIVWFVSVTSLIKSTMPTSPHLIKWMVENGENSDAIRDEKASYGTAMHIAIGMYLLSKFDLSYNSISQFLAQHGVQSHYSKQLQKDILSFAQFCIDYDVKPLAIEIMLSDLKLGLAGSCDLVCQMTVKGKRIIAMIDFKSGRKGFWEDNEIQLHAYKRLFESEFTDIRIEKLFNWSPKDWVKGPTYNLKDQTDTQSGQKLDYLIEIFKLSGKQKPSSQIEVTGEIGLGMPVSDKFRIVDFEQFIKGNDEYFKQYITIGESTIGRISRPQKFNEVVNENLPFLTDDDVEVDSPFGSTEAAVIQEDFLDF